MSGPPQTIKIGSTIVNTNVCATSFYTIGSKPWTWVEGPIVNITILNYKKFKEKLLKQVEPV